MLLYPSLAIGFLFVGVPLLVHLINLLRHRKTQWAAMDFLLASYRKQRRWIVLRQLLLLLSRLAVAALLISLLAGLIGGKKLIGAIGGHTTHHVIVLDDSYSMRQKVDGSSSAVNPGISSADLGTRNVSSRDTTAYDRALSAIAALTRRLADDDGIHQLTVMRASRAAMFSQGKSSADAAADVAAQTITGDARQVERLMSTRASTLRTDLVPAIDLASDLLTANPADSRRLYVISDFSRRDWSSPRRLEAALEKAEKSGAEIRMVDCVEDVSDVPRNLAITDLSPEPDVWVAGVPVMVNATIKNFSDVEVKNVAMTASVITYGDDVAIADPTSTLSGQSQSLPAIMIESIPAGQQLTKSFQVYIDKQGTHVVRVGLPDDALAIDNTRVCTIPLLDAQRVLIIDGNADGMGAYHVSSVLDPGSQVRVGAIPEVRPVATLRDANLETLSRYRAIYLIDVPEISERIAAMLAQYVRDGGGLAWFLGDEVVAGEYNRLLHVDGRELLPFELERVQSLETDRSTGEFPEPQNDAGGDDSNELAGNRVVFGKDADMLGPISRAGNGVFGLVNLRKAWLPVVEESVENLTNSDTEPEPAPDSQLGPKPVNDITTSEQVVDDLDVRVLVQRGDGVPLVTRHVLGRGRVVTVLTGLGGTWNNWPGDPTFVVMLLQTNAMLFSGAAPPTSRYIDEPAEIALPGDSFLSEVTLLPPADEPPRLAITLEADGQTPVLSVSPTEMMIADQSGFDEFLMPGVAEWQRVGTDGRTSVLPMASVLRVGESDLASASQAEILRDLPGLEIEFLSAGAWQNDVATGGMSTFLLILLMLLALMIAIEQALAAWASYHVRSNSAPSRRHPSTHAGHNPMAGARGRSSTQRADTVPLATDVSEIRSMEEVR